jgi:hypothetical protein
MVKPNRISAVIADARHKPRFNLEIDIAITSRTCGTLLGRTVDISESGIAAMLTVKAQLGEVVELNLTIPCGAVAIHAMVRERNAFRYGSNSLTQISYTNSSGGRAATLQWTSPCYRLTVGEAFGTCAVLDKRPIPPE